MHAVAEPIEDLPPHAIEAEMCLIASLMLMEGERALFEETRAGITPASFVQPDHGMMFAAIVDLHNRDAKIDSETIRNELIRRKQFDLIGGTVYLAKLLNGVPSPRHGPDYAKIVREKALLRAIGEIADEAKRQAFTAANHGRATEIIGETAARLARLSGEAGSTQYTTGGAAAIEVLESLEKGSPPLIKLGIPALDDAIGGIGLGEMMILGARPSMGKSTSCRQILLDAARSGTPTLLVSLEESRAKIARNMLSRLARVENSALRRGQVKANEWKPLQDGVSTIDRVPLYIADKAFTMTAIRSVVTMLVAKHGVKLVLVDYLQRVRVPGTGRYEQVTTASQELSALWKELDVAGVVAAQLNRDAPKRDNKRPGMTDLRESGQIEQDADQIVMLHREDYYRATGESSEGIEADHVAEFIFVKFRDGCRGGTVKMRSNLIYQDFEPMEQTDDNSLDPFQ